jgi:hypothetical protein
MDGATHVPRNVETLRMFWRWQQLCATSSLHVSRRANETMSCTIHAGNHYNPCLQMYISWFPAARLERHAPSVPLSVPTHATEEEPLQFASTTLFDASISRLISRRLPTESLRAYASSTHGKCRSPLGYSKQSWGRGMIEEDQPTSTSTPRLQPT